VLKDKVYEGLQGQIPTGRGSNILKNMLTQFFGLSSRKNASLEKFWSAGKADQTSPEEEDMKKGWPLAWFNLVCDNTVHCVNFEHSQMHTTVKLIPPPLK